MEEQSSSGSSVAEREAEARTVKSAPFGTVDITDGGRKLLEWQSKYPKAAQRWIWAEAAYLAVLLLLGFPAICLSLWLEYPKVWFAVPDEKYEAIFRFGLAAAGGMLGGTLFAFKWLYHVVARMRWHMDRRLWRFCTPLISSGLACAMVAVVSSGVLRIFDPDAFQSPSLVVGFSFLVGYFSDSAAAKLTEIAETLFGPTRDKEKHRIEAGDATTNEPHD